MEFSVTAGKGGPASACRGSSRQGKCIAHSATAINRTERETPMKSTIRSGSGKVKPVPSQASSYGGLCTNCVNLDICSLAAGSGRHVFYCEEFTSGDGVPPLTSQPVQSPADSETVRGGTRHDSAEDYTGLCTTCRSRGDCVFSKHEGGMWHCEEYR